MVLDRFLAALSAGDPEGVRAVLAPGAELDGAPPGDPVDVLMAQRSRWPSYRERVVRTFRDGTTIAAETLLDTGSVRHGVLVAEVHDDGIRRLAGWRRETGTSPSSARATVEAYFAAANAKDWAAMADLWHADATLHAMGGPPRHGRDAILRAYRRFLEPWAVNHDRVRWMEVDGPTVSVGVRFEGETVSGRRGEAEIVDVIHVEDGCIRRLWFCVDVGAWAAMLYPSRIRSISS
jgi:ketosteroid isomerase-like protein